MNKHIKKLSALMAVVLCMAALSIPAFASGDDYYASDESGGATPPDSIESITVSTENVNVVQSQSSATLTPDGNLTLVDDLLQSDTYASVEASDEVENKQFITVQSKNGNYFYLVIDRSGDTENVYFLNLVDEADLLALMDEDDTTDTAVQCTCEEKCVIGAIDTNCSVCRTDLSECTGKQTTTEPEPEATTSTDTDTSSEDTATTEKKSNSPMLLLLLVLIGAGGGAAFYWFKVKNNKPQNKGSADLDDYDYGQDDEDEEETEIDDADLMAEQNDTEDAE